MPGTLAATPSSQTEQNAAPGIHYYYLIMEFVDGVNLRQAMRAGRFTPQQALAVVPGICDALQAAHAQGVWHRDIKPENILLDAQGGVKIVDFGIARLVGDPQRDFTLTVTGAALGSAAYMAPEQHEKPHDVDHRADIYSLGVVIYEMLTGELPLGRFPAPSARAAVDARIDEIVFRTLEKERHLRQQSAEEVKTDVHRAAKNVDSAPENRGDRPANVTLWALGLILGGCVMAGAAVAFTRGSTQGVMLTFAVVAVALGWIASWFALSSMRHGRIAKPWRRGLRFAAWTPVLAAAVLAVSVPTIYFLRSGGRGPVSVAKRTAEQAELATHTEDLKALTSIMTEAMRLAATKTPEELQALENARRKSEGGLAEHARLQAGLKASHGEGLPKTAASPAGSYTADYVEKFFRKMNALANESNSEEFIKLTSAQAKAMRGNVAVATVMEHFTGTILSIEVLPPSPAFPATAFARVYAVTGKRDGVMDARLFTFETQRGLRYFDSYSAAESRVEFRPEKGNAEGILRAHLHGTTALAPVPGTDGEFRLFGIALSGDAGWSANATATNLRTSLAKVGLDSAFRVVQPAIERKAKSFFISGQVGKPGIIVIPEQPVTVSMAVSIAGGPTRIAALEKVELHRVGADGGTKTITVDVKKALAGKVAPEEDPVVLPGDKINVPESKF